MRSCGPLDVLGRNSRRGQEINAEVETVGIIEQLFNAHLGDLALQKVADGGLVLVKQVNKLALAVEVAEKGLFGGCNHD
jgi:hypothetical protein